jgi:hypothetical protein
MISVAHHGLKGAIAGVLQGAGQAYSPGAGACEGSLSTRSGGYRQISLAGSYQSSQDDHGKSDPVANVSATLRRAA